MAREAQRACDRLAATQHGVLGHAPQRGPQRVHLVRWPSGLEQAIAAGMSRFAISRRTAAGQWEAVLPGVYRVAAVPETWHQRLISACLWCGAAAAASHRSAAALLGLRGFKEGIVEVSTTANRKGGPDWLTCHRVVDLPEAQITRALGIPVTTADRTLLPNPRGGGCCRTCSACGSPGTSLPTVSWRLLCFA